MNFKESLPAVKESVNEAIKETGLKMTNLSLEEHWRANLTISVPNELEQLTAKLAALLRNEGIEMRKIQESLCYLERAGGLPCLFCLWGFESIQIAV